MSENQGGERDVKEERDLVERFKRATKQPIREVTTTRSRENVRMVLYWRMR
jgi:hypothetical protein